MFCFSVNSKWCRTVSIFVSRTAEVTCGVAITAVELLHAMPALCGFNGDVDEVLPHVQSHCSDHTRCVVVTWNCNCKRCHWGHFAVIQLSSFQVVLFGLFGLRSTRVAVAIAVDGTSTTEMNYIASSLSRSVPFSIVQAHFNNKLVRCRSC